MPDAVADAVAGDLAAHHDLVEPGPGPLRRAAAGLVLGAVLGAVASVLTRRPRA